MSSVFGKIFTVSTWGESHGKAVGAVVDGCPAGLPLCEADIQKYLDRRRPGQNLPVTPRDEADKVEILSGVFEGKTTGTPISLLVKNEDQHSKDYGDLVRWYRPGHADFAYDKKYGFRDYRGGGRSSAREAIEASPVRCPDPKAAERMQNLILDARRAKDSVGGTVTFLVRRPPESLGEPVFDRTEALLAMAMLSIPATKGFEIGSGFAGTRLHGSAHNDTIVAEDGKFRTLTNNAGGTYGGITTGADILCRVAFKPTATIGQVQKTASRDGENGTLEMKGRHDPCVALRAPVIVESMAALVLVDLFLEQRARGNLF